MRHPTLVVAQDPPIHPLPPPIHQFPGGITLPCTPFSGEWEGDASHSPVSVLPCTSHRREVADETFLGHLVGNTVGNTAPPDLEAARVGDLEAPRVGDLEAARVGDFEAPRVGDFEAASVSSRRSVFPRGTRGFLDRFKRQVSSTGFLQGFNDRFPRQVSTTGFLECFLEATSRRHGPRRPSGRRGNAARNYNPAMKEGVWACSQRVGVGVHSERG